MGWEVVQIGVHLLERVLGLREEVVDYTLAKFTLVLVIVHFKDLGQVVAVSKPCPPASCIRAGRTHLFKRRRVDDVPEVQEHGRTVFGLTQDRTISTGTVRGFARRARVCGRGVARQVSLRRVATRCLTSPRPLRAGADVQTLAFVVRGSGWHAYLYVLGLPGGRHGG